MTHTHALHGARLESDVWYPVDAAATWVRWSLTSRMIERVRSECRTSIASGPLPSSKR